MSEHLEDHELLRRIGAGDAQAFAELFRRRQGDVYRFALHMTASPSVADDVTQEVFLAVMNDPGRYVDGRSSVAAWLCGIARNHVRRRLERDRGFQSLDAETASSAGVPAAAVDPAGDLAQEQRIDRLRRAILTLPVAYREAVVLCELQELSYADAAEALGCAVGTVRSRLHRGRSLLAAKMRAVEAGPRRLGLRHARSLV